MAERHSDAIRQDHTYMFLYQYFAAAAVANTAEVWGEHLFRMVHLVIVSYLLSIKLYS